MSTLKYAVSALGALALCLAACEPQVEDSSSSDRYLYVTSGGCYVGLGLTAETPSRTVSRINLSTGNIDYVLMDYNTVNNTDKPATVVDYNSENILVLVENTTSRRIDLVKKSGGNSFSTWLSDTTILTTTASHVARNMVQTPDGGLLISKSVAAEKVSSSKGRVTSGASSFINAPNGGTCGTTNNSLITAVIALPNSKYIFSHASASPNNHVVLINNTNGYSASADCSSAVAAPAATTYPTAMAYIPPATSPGSGFLLVAYSSSTAGQDYIYAYDVDESSGVISGATKAYENPSVLRGISSMTYDTQTGNLYVSNGATILANGIEKFTFASSTKTLTRSGTVPFSGTSLYTKCITSMKVSD